MRRVSRLAAQAGRQHRTARPDSVPAGGVEARAGDSQPALDRRSAAHCLPQASPASPGQPVPDRVRAHAEKARDLYEYLWEFRSIPIGGSHADDADPSFIGDSVARWEGDTLVVDVTNFKAGGWLGGGFVTATSCI
jgi:hypothetical protein